MRGRRIQIIFIMNSLHVTPLSWVHTVFYCVDYFHFCEYENMFSSFLLNLPFLATYWFHQIKQAHIALRFKSWLPWQRKQPSWCPGLSDFLDCSTRRGTVSVWSYRQGAWWIQAQVNTKNYEHLLHFVVFYFGRMLTDFTDAFRAYFFGTGISYDCYSKATLKMSVNEPHECATTQGAT